MELALAGDAGAASVEVTTDKSSSVALLSIAIRLCRIPASKLRCIAPLPDG